MDDVIEIMARGVFANDGRYDGKKFDYCSPRLKGFFRSDAQSALQALEAAGYQIVPKEPTVAMQVIGGDTIADLSGGSDGWTADAYHVYRAMLEAAK